MDEKISALLIDEAFCEKLTACADIREATALFADNGAVITAEELTAVLSELVPVGELDEGALDSVSGGIVRARRTGHNTGKAVIKWLGRILGLNSNRKN